MASPTAMASGLLKALMPTTAGCGWLGARGPSGPGARGVLYRASATSAARFRRSSCEDKRDTAETTAGAACWRAPGPAALGGRRRHTWLLPGTPYRASAKSAARFSSTSWGQGERQRDGGAAPGGDEGALGSPSSLPCPQDTLSPAPPL